MSRLRELKLRNSKAYTPFMELVEQLLDALYVNNFSELELTNPNKYHALMRSVFETTSRLKELTPKNSGGIDNQELVKGKYEISAMDILHWLDDIEYCEAEAWLRLNPEKTHDDWGEEFSNRLLEKKELGNLARQRIESRLSENKAGLGDALEQLSNENNHQLR